MRYPIVIVDFEASSLGLDSYPIEVGAAIAVAPDKPLCVWTSLIQPAREWVSRGDWDAASERIHGISSASLAHGCAAKEVAEALNRIIGPIGHAYCDGGYYDGMWLERLYRAARIEANFALWDMSGLFVLDRHLFRRFSAILAETEAPHRAGEDAARLCSALIKASQ